MTKAAPREIEAGASVRNLETDYLIIGAGAMGMAFADELLTRSSDAHITLIDRRAKPGGHWNDAYRFVRLHQPAAFYGVNSETLGSGGTDLASGPKILAYYEVVLEKLLATGRVRFFPQCNYEGEGRFRSMLDADLVYQATVHRKTVNAAYMNVEVPATHPPKYTAAPGVSLVPINALAQIDQPWSRFVVIGAGKTGMDAILLLLNRRVNPDRITWIVSNDAWLLNRAITFPDEASRALPQQLRCIGQADSADDLFRAYEDAGWTFRLDKNIWPTKFRCATVSPEELVALQTIPHIVRLGRVSHIGPAQIVLEKGTVPTATDVLHIDCTADGLVKRPKQTVFTGDQITLQPLMICQQVFSAALIAMVETRYTDDAVKNAMCQPVQHPEFPRDYFSTVVTSFTNLTQWLWRFGWWLLTSRLSAARHMSLIGIVRMIVGAIRWMSAAIDNLQRLDQAFEDLPSEGEPATKRGQSGHGSVPEVFRGGHGPQDGGLGSN